MTDPVVQEREHEVLVRLHGEVDRSTSGALREALEQAIAEGRPLVLIDMTDVSYIDSAGLSALVSGRRRLVEGQRIALCNVPARMQRVLQLTAFDQLLDVHSAGEQWPWADVVPPSR
jgi:anti-sigma B factor antagonist